jgi:rubrerythrin
MSPIVDVAQMDLRDALDFAVLVEEDAQLRYEELARALGDDPGGAGAVFRAMAVNEGMHRRTVEERRAAIFREAEPRLEISALEGPERPDVADGELPATARQALEISLAAERRAHAFYARALSACSDPEVRAFLEDLLRDEAEHAALLEAKLAAMGAPAAPLARVAPRRADAPATPPAYQDRELLTAILPRFDAATRMVAQGVVVEGLPEEAVAESLGVSRRTVARKLARFLEVAREHIAVALAAAALTGCGGLGFPEAPAAGDRGDVRQALHATAEQADGAPAEAAPEHAREGAVAGGGAGGEPAARGREADEPGGAAAGAEASGAEAAASPVIEEVSPQEAPASGGTAVVIRGKDLNPAHVTVGGTPGRILDATEYMVIVELPAANAGQVAIVVTNRDGRSAISGSFRYTE